MNRSGQGITPYTSPYHGTPLRDKHFACSDNSRGFGWQQPFSFAAISQVVSTAHSPGKRLLKAASPANSKLVGCVRGLR